MATGVVTSQSLPKTSTQPQAVIRTGEKIVTSGDALAAKGAKTYYHSAHGAQFIMPDGLAVVFMGGRFTTADPAIIAELDKVANKAASFITTKEDQQEVAALLDGAAKAAITS